MAAGPWSIRLRALLTRALLAAFVLTAVPSLSTVEVTTSVPEVVEGSVPVAISTAASTIAAGADGADSADDVEVHRSSPVAAPQPFSMIGFELPDGVDTVRVRTAADDGVWSEWYELGRTEAADGPDADTVEGRRDRSDRFTEPAWTGDATRFQVEVLADEAAGVVDASGELALEATVIDAAGAAAGDDSIRIGGAVAEASITRPRIVSRAEWGAQAPRDTPTVNKHGVDLVVVHHTAGRNDYSRAESPARVRAYQHYHRNVLEWSDIGYNALVDRYGTIYEGRAGGFDRAVQGAHASGFNANSFGVSVMGNFTNVDAPQAAYESLADVIAWKATVHDFDPLGTTERMAKGVRVRTVTGHKDVGTTSCPGLIANRLWWIRTEAAERRGPTPQPEPATNPTPEPTPAPENRFSDVTTASSFYDAIVKLDHEGVLNGYPDDTFRPDGSLTRGQMATIFVRAMGLTPKAPTGQFRDVTSSTAHREAITALVETGIVNGYPDGTYRPHQAVRRDQIATFLSTAKGLSPASSTVFKDVSSGNTHRGWIGAAHAKRYIWGYPGDLYYPERDLRRDHAAEMVVRAFSQ